MNIILWSCMTLLVLVAGCREQAKPVRAFSTAARQAVAVTTVLATIAEQERPFSPASQAGHTPHAQSTPFQVLFGELGGGAAYLAEKDGRVSVVHNGKAGKHYASVGEVTLSPDGRRAAFAALVDQKWRMVVDGTEGSSFNAVGPPRFSPDGRHVAYSALLGDKWFIVVDGAMNAGTTANYSGWEFNNDSTLIAYAENADDSNSGRMIVSDLAFRSQVVLEGVGAPFVTNSESSRIAAVRREREKVQIVEFSFRKPREFKAGPLYDAIKKVAYGPDGMSLAYDADAGENHVLIFMDREERIPKGVLIGPPVISGDLKAVGIITAKKDPVSQHMSADAGDNAARMYQMFHDAKREKEFEEVAGLVYSSDGSAHAYAARMGQLWFVVVNGKMGEIFDRVVSPVFSPDGKVLVYRARKDGKRFVVVADTSGKILKRHPFYEQVFQPVFTSDGKSIAYGVKDGNKLVWTVEGL